MPTYEYECLECKHRFEVEHSMNADPVQECIRCGKKVRKVFSSAGIIFKGSGFYKNDYRKKGGESSPKQADSACASCSSASVCQQGGEG